jgi:hypothetical protein
MRRSILPLLTLMLLALAEPAAAQSAVTLESIHVQLWPEYDQPSMLVIYDFKLPPDAKLPSSVSIAFPASANLIAVASQASDGSLLNTDYVGPTTSGEWKTITVHVQTAAVYHLEYYQPLNRTGQDREFTYFWLGDYPVGDFSLSVRKPVDTTSITTDPPMQAQQASDGATYLSNDFGALAQGRGLSVEVKYARTSDSLSASQQDLQPSQPIDSNTAGRVMLSNYLPYVAGALGVVLIVGGIIFYWQSNRAGDRGREKRHKPAEDPDRHADAIYCHQCGTRAQDGDRFCRVCGTRLRPPE